MVNVSKICKKIDDNRVWTELSLDYKRENPGIRIEKERFPIGIGSQGVQRGVFEGSGRRNGLTAVV